MTTASWQRSLWMLVLCAVRGVPGCDLCVDCLVVLVCRSSVVQFVPRRDAAVFVLPCMTLLSASDILSSEVRSLFLVVRRADRRKQTVAGIGAKFAEWELLALISTLCQRFTFKTAMEQEPSLLPLAILKPAQTISIELAMRERKP